MSGSSLKCVTCVENDISTNFNFCTSGKFDAENCGFGLKLCIDYYYLKLGRMWITRKCSQQTCQQIQAEYSADSYTVQCSECSEDNCNSDYIDFSKIPKFKDLKRMAGSIWSFASDDDTEKDGEDERKHKEEEKNITEQGVEELKCYNCRAIDNEGSKFFDCDGGMIDTTNSCKGSCVTTEVRFKENKSSMVERSCEETVDAFERFCDFYNSRKNKFYRDGIQVVSCQECHSDLCNNASERRSGSGFGQNHYGYDSSSSCLASLSLLLLSLLYHLLTFINNPS